MAVSPLRRAVFVVGDSISMQYGPFLEAALAKSGIAYGRKGGEGNEDDLDNPSGLGANGGDSTMVLQYLTDRISHDRLEPGLLLLNAGLHDIKRPPSPEAAGNQVAIESYAANLNAIVELARGMQGVAPVWLRTTPSDDVIHNAKLGQNGVEWLRFQADNDAYRSAADEVMAAAKVPVIDLFGFTSGLGPSSDLFSDHIHFEEHIRDKQGRFVADWVINHLDKAPLESSGDSDIDSEEEAKMLYDNEEYVGTQGFDQKRGRRKMKRLQKKPVATVNPEPKPAPAPASAPVVSEVALADGDSESDSDLDDEAEAKMLYDNDDYTGSHPDIHKKKGIRRKKKPAP